MLTLPLAGESSRIAIVGDPRSGHQSSVGCSSGPFRCLGCEVSWSARWMGFILSGHVGQLFCLVFVCRCRLDLSHRRQRHRDQYHFRFDSGFPHPHPVRPHQSLAHFLHHLPHPYLFHRPRPPVDSP